MLGSRTRFTGSGFTAFLVVLTLAMPGAVQAGDISAQEIQGVIAQAQRMLEKARALDHAWSVSPEYISKAETEMEAGHMQSAMAWAQRALLTADKAVQQAGVEAVAWRDRVPSLAQ